MLFERFLVKDWFVVEIIVGTIIEIIEHSSHDWLRIADFLYM